MCIDEDKMVVAQARFERELPDFPVHCILPAQLSSYLTMIGPQLEASDASEPKLQRLANHDLTRRTTKLSAKERQRIEEKALQAIAIAIKAAQPDSP